MSGRFDHLLSSVSSCASNSERLVVLRAQGNTAGEHLMHTCCAIAAWPLCSKYLCPVSFNAIVILPANGPQASYTLVGCALFTHLRCPAAPCFPSALPTYQIFHFIVDYSLSVAVVPICGRARVTATGLRWPLASTQLEMGR